MPERKPSRLSLHEAGHVIVGDALGMKFSSVSVDEGRYEGRASPSPGTPKMSVRNYLSTLYGGPLAEALILGDIHDNSGHPRSDFDCAEEVVAKLKLDPERAEGILKEARGQAWDILQARSKRLEHFACVLDEKRRLDEAQIAYFLHDPVAAL